MSSPCSCPVAGFCARHGVNKSPAHHKLCQTKPAYRKAWDEGRLHGQKPSVGPAVEAKPMETVELWKEAHEYAKNNADNWDEKATREWYAKWLKKIPKFGCGCTNHWAALTLANPPQFESPLAFFTWFWARHNDVSRTQSKKPELTLDEAFGLWWPDHQNISPAQ